MSFSHENPNNVNSAQHSIDPQQIVSALQAIEVEVRTVCFSGEIRDVETAIELSNMVSRTVHLASAPLPDIASIQAHLNLIAATLRHFPKQVELRQLIHQTRDTLHRFA